MPFPRNLLTDDEDLILDLRPHWWFLAPAGVLLVVAVLLGLIALIRDWASDGLLTEHPMATFLIAENRNDINPLIVKSDCVVAVDGLIVLQDDNGTF